jgi:hypothetical protein
MQTSQGAIKSFEERRTEIWNSGITSILALLQTSIESQEIQNQVETTYVQSCKRAVGLKIMRDLLSNHAPWDEVNSTIQWFCSSLRKNTNNLCHYLDDTVGQGLLLETIS